MPVRRFAVLVVVLAACRESPSGTGGPPPSTGAPGLHVQGNRLVDAGGHVVRLRGVDRSGAEYACAQGRGIFDGPTDSAAVAAIADFVARLNGAGLVVILDLHWSASDSGIALGQAPMPDRDHSPEFWRQVAATFKGNDAVIFQAAGMQELVDAVRGTGATNVIMVGGIEYAADLASWPAYRPVDPLGNVAASWHIYNFSWCNTRSCWDGAAATVAQQVPLVPRRAGAGRRRQRVRRLTHGLDGRPDRELSRLDLGRMGPVAGPHHELRWHPDGLRPDLQDAVSAVGSSDSHRARQSTRPSPPAVASAGRECLAVPARLHRAEGPGDVPGPSCGEGSEAG